MKKLSLILGMAFWAYSAAIAQGGSEKYVLTLEECHRLAIDANKELEEAGLKVKMAEYDKKTARANYLPNVSATAGYIYNSKNIQLLSDEMSYSLSNMGTAVQGQIGAQVQQIMTAIQTNPLAAQEYMGSAMWQTVLGAMSKTDVSQAINQIGTSVAEAFELDNKNVYAGVINITQPVFTGGKILSANRMATLAEQLARTQYDTEYQEILIDVDKSYWQIVSIANKVKLAESFIDLIDLLYHNAEIAVAEGIATQSDLLTIKVKRNEAQLMLTKATNGLSLSKMLLCKQVGLPLDSVISLTDETLDSVPVPSVVAEKDMALILADRPEAKSLELAGRIYDQKANIAKSEMMPTIALTANYVVSNPSVYNGFQNKFDGMYNAGVMMNIPLFHGTEALQKTRKAKAEAELYRIKYEEACEMINLQVEQLTKQQTEALEHLEMAESNLDSAEENLRTAMIGYEEGLLSADVTLMAQTAWMQAHSEFIDAGIELQMNNSELLKAQGEYTRK